MRSNEPIVAHDKCLQSVCANRGKVVGGTHFNDQKCVWHGRVRSLKKKLFKISFSTDLFPLASPHWTRPHIAISLQCSKSSVQRLTCFFPTNELRGLVSEENVVLRRWGSDTPKFGLSTVDNVN